MDKKVKSKIKQISATIPLDNSNSDESFRVLLANALTEVEDLWSGTTWLDEDGENIYLNFQDPEFKIDAGIELGRCSEKPQNVAMRLLVACNAALVGSAIGKYELNKRRKE